ncbi:site-specific DNA-methyltransferase [Parafrigoribacterium mesophilum]|uniref:site-specific DNA-methyltransferase n=1 Tax=Parafrigoribacterium mesophilum TaxID=433646 RepID=UPI0031FC2910
MHPAEKRAEDNLLIRGDALHALTSLAKIPEFADEYLGKIRLAYIDPPFNTGQAFAQYDDNLEHSIWLTMMRDRLLQIRDLLASDGSVWVHLDDAEVHRARLVLDEVFGPKAFVTEIVWEKADSPRNSARQFSTDHDYILVYGREEDWRPTRLARTAESDVIYTNPDNDERGPWYPGDPFATKPYSKGGFTIVGPTGRSFCPPLGNYWRVSEDRLRELDADNRVWWGPTGDARPSLKRYLSDVMDLVPRTIWTKEDVGSNRTSKNEIKKLFPGKTPFSTPKPERLMERILRIATSPGDIILDCFAGSGTTAAVAHKLGRRWVTVEWSRDTVEGFTMPRLSKVIGGEDQGGVTRTLTVEAVNDALPAEIPVERVKAAVLVLKSLNGYGLLDSAISSTDLSKVLRALRGLSKTRKVTVTNWSGGGGFRVLDVGPSMFDEEDGQILLAPWAAGDRLAEAVAAQYNFEFETDVPFSGRRGNERLAVIDGLVNDAVIDFLLGWLPPGELLVAYGTGVDPYAQERLAEEHRGSTLEKIPEAIISNYRQVNRRTNGLNWAAPLVNATSKGQ